MTRPPFGPVTERDMRIVTAQLGRPARDVVGIPARCVCGAPTVVATAPRLADGTPFPTFYYLSHPVATAAMSFLEAAQLMVECTELLAADADLRDRLRARPRRLPRRPRGVRRRRRDRRHLGRRHARRGSSACTRSPRTRSRRARREPDRRHRARALVVVARPSASAPTTVSTSPREPALDETSGEPSG